MSGGEPAPDAPFRRLARTCPRCGAREPTLGSRCPVCDAPYDPPSLVDRVTYPGDDLTFGGLPLLGGLFAAVAALLSLVAQVVLAPARWALGRLASRRRG